MPDDMEERLLVELLRETYREINPDPSVNADFLIRKLAGGIYARGARIQMGANRPPKLRSLHVSVDRQDLICWTDKDVHDWLGYRPRALIGRPVDTILSPGSAAFRREFGLPELLREGRVGPVPATFIGSAGDVLVGTIIAEVLRDSRGEFLRTFTRILTPYIGVLYLIA